MTEVAPRITVNNAPAENGAITYTSSDPKTLTIDENGNITLVGAGTSYITVTFGETANYSESTSEQIEVKVRRDELTINDFKYVIADKEYTGAEQGIEVTAKAGITGIGAITVSYNKVEVNEQGEVTERTAIEGKPIKAGKYEVILNVARGTNYKALENAVLGIYTITTASIAGADVEINLLTEEELVYDGTPKVPTVKSVELNGITLDKDNDYNVKITYAKYDKNTDTFGEFTDEEPINVGTYKAKVVVVGIGNYTGDIITYITIPITEKAVSSIKITKFPSKVNYKYGEELDLTGGEMLVTYNDGTTNTIDMSKVEISSDYVSTQIGTRYVTIEYNGKTDASYEVTVKDYIKGIEIENKPSKIVYIKGQETTLNTEGMKVIALKASEEELDEKTEITTDVTLTGYNLNPTVQGKQTVTVTYIDNDENNSSTYGEEFTTSFEIVVLAE